MKYVAKLVLAVAFALAIVATASAQGRPGGGFTGGFGFGTQNAYSMIATNKVLQDELKVTDDQKTKLADALKPIAAKRGELFGGAGGNRRPGGQGGQRPMLTEEQRKEREEKLAKLNDETKKAVEGVLDEKQSKRLGQIGVQLLGFGAYSDKTVQEKLKLDEGQKDKIKGIAEEYGKDSAELRREAPRGAFGFGGRPGGQKPSDEDQKKIADYTKKSEGLRKEAEDKVVAVLSADQKNAWKEIVGEKADVQKIRAAGFQRPTQRRDN